MLDVTESIVAFIVAVTIGDVMIGSGSVKTDRSLHRPVEFLADVAFWF
jgi:hypothetical protein